jgi:hypothetical protein
MGMICSFHETTLFRARSAREARKREKESIALKRQFPSQATIAAFIWRSGRHKAME